MLLLEVTVGSAVVLLISKYAKRIKDDEQGFDKTFDSLDEMDAFLKKHYNKDLFK